MDTPDFASWLDLHEAEPATYSVCTLVTRPEQYARMCESFVAKGFAPQDTEYLYIDNSKGNVADAFSAYRRFLTTARNTFVILCHQDVLLTHDGRAELDAALAELTDKNATWALAGNAGAMQDGHLALRISDPHGTDRRLGNPLPRRVMSLDENFIVVRRRANLALSADLNGFHLYGADLCVLADVLGHSAYAIDFHLDHASGGNKDSSFTDMQMQFEAKYARAFRSRWLPLPTLSPVRLSGSKSWRVAQKALKRLRIRRRYNQVS